MNVDRSRLVGVACFLLFFGLMGAPRVTAEPSVARRWDEALLDAIRIDIPRPTVHARNLYHTSAAMYDAWATYDTTAQGVFYGPKHGAEDVRAARDEAISYAAYRVLSHRYRLSVAPVPSQAIFDQLMDQLGYDPNFTDTTADSPAAIGNRIAARILSTGSVDGANEAANYADTTHYQSINLPMVVDYPSVTLPYEATLADPNRWQQLFIDSLTTQNGIPFGTKLQQNITPHWGNVSTFAMGRGTSGGPHSWSAVDPGAPPRLNGPGDAYREHVLDVIRYSNQLDPTQGQGSERINASPSATGNRPLGTHQDVGYLLNPVTGQPYADNWVKRADYGRVLAEFWADGPHSETPPGHWNTIANLVSDHPLTDKRIGGSGPVASDLEWDVKLYLALNGAVHDAGIAAWGAKREYDYPRPISMIRNMAMHGQSSDAAAPSYDPQGLPLEAGLIELITAETIAPGGRHRNAYLNANRDKEGNFAEFFTEADLVGKIAIHAWNHQPDNPETEIGGTEWILGINWLPYQRENFVTPAFPGYVSGHSTFSRSAAEVLARFTGSPYFPGGLGEATFLANDYLHFEAGPTENITLQWASYFDAADEAGISRLWGGIHVAPDDFAGRIMGSTIGREAYARAVSLYGVPEPSAIWLALVAASCLAPRCRRGRNDSLNHTNH